MVIPASFPGLSPRLISQAYLPGDKHHKYGDTASKMAILLVAINSYIIFCNNNVVVHEQIVHNAQKDENTLFLQQHYSGTIYGVIPNVSSIIIEGVNRE